MTFCKIYLTFCKVCVIIQLQSDIDSDLFLSRGESMKNKKMKIARMERDMNQEDLAKAVGVTRQTIGMIESGNYNPTLKLCIAICKALGKTLDQLFWEEEE